MTKNKKGLIKHNKTFSPPQKDLGIDDLIEKHIVEPSGWVIMWGDSFVSTGFQSMNVTHKISLANFFDTKKEAQKIKKTLSKKYPQMELEIRAVKVV